MSIHFRCPAGQAVAGEASEQTACEGPLRHALHTACCLGHLKSILVRRSHTGVR